MNNSNPIAGNSFNTLGDSGQQFWNYLLSVLQILALTSISFVFYPFDKGQNQKPTTTTMTTANPSM
jgi:hypothetical protein